MQTELASVNGERSLSGVDLHLGYHGVPVVHGAVINLRAGAVTALVGPNGSGKSTLLRALARLHPIEAGAVHLADGVTAASLAAREFARRVTLLAQSRPVPSGVTVRDVVGYGRHPYRGRWRAEDPDGPAADRTRHGRHRRRRDGRPPRRRTLRRRVAAGLAGHLPGPGHPGPAARRTHHVPRPALPGGDPRPGPRPRGRSRRRRRRRAARPQPGRRRGGRGGPAAARAGSAPPAPRRRCSPRTPSPRPTASASR